MVTLSLLVLVLFLAGYGVTKLSRKLRQGKPLSTCAVRSSSSVQYTHQAIPPMVTVEELAKLETPAFLRVRKAANKNLQAVHAGKASCLADMEMLALPEQATPQVVPVEGKRRKSRRQQMADTVAVQEVFVPGSEASLLLPDPTQQVF